jgi:uncharacterized membrane protein YebE (DUF533 family)
VDDQLRNHLDELEAAITASRADGQIDDDERVQLRELLERVRADLGAEEADRGGLAEQLEESAVRFESDHPTIAAAIRSAVNTLTGYGI